MPYVDPRECLELPQRRHIYEQIRDRPGRTLSDLQRASGLGSATVLWHTEKLIHAKLVITESHLGMRLYHATGLGAPGKRMGRAVAVLSDKRSRGIIESVQAGILDIDAICRALRSDRARVEAVMDALVISQARSDHGLHWGLATALPLAQSSTQSPYTSTHH